MKGFTVADIQASTEAITWRVGMLRSSSITLTSIRGRKQTRNEMKIVSIIWKNKEGLKKWQGSFLASSLFSFSVSVAS